MFFVVEGEGNLCVCLEFHIAPGCMKVQQIGVGVRLTFEPHTHLYCLFCLYCMYCPTADIHEPEGDVLAPH